MVEPSETTAPGRSALKGPICVFGKDDPRNALKVIKFYVAIIYTRFPFPSHPPKMFENLVLWLKLVVVHILDVQNSNRNANNPFAIVNLR